MEIQQGISSGEGEDGRSGSGSGRRGTMDSEKRGKLKRLMTPGLGSWFIMAPELLNGESYDFTCDIFSFGLIVAEILLLVVLFIIYCD